ncbi:D-ribose pyranase [Pontibacillus salicampi]|uniref:D-ribose pyranase n=1 Tax=Pontibacillus salicampi TaxID=1449801 RepID=A0ABV6LRV1_9BACI
MKRNGMINSHIAKVLADLGHTDTIVVADAGLPVPEGVPKIDLSLNWGIPSVVEVLRILQQEMIVEQVTVAEELQEGKGQLHKDIVSIFKQLDYVSHETFKSQTHHAKAVIRTGEATPFANCILHAGVSF